MSDPIVIELDGPPIAWARTRVNTAVRRSRFYTPKNQRDYATALVCKGRKAMGGRALLIGPLSINVTARLPVPASWHRNKKARAVAGDVLPTSKPDWDNFAKLAGDALNCVVYCDDAQICKATVRKFYSENPGLRIEVSQIRDASEKEAA